MVALVICLTAVFGFLTLALGLFGRLPLPLVQPAVARAARPRRLSRRRAVARLLGVWGLFGLLGAQGALAQTTWYTQADAHRGQTGLRFAYPCPGQGSVDASRPVWGTDIYTDDSGICLAAVHAGLLTLAAGGPVTIEILAGQAMYTESLRNGVKSFAYGTWGGSFRFVTDDPATTPCTAGTRYTGSLTGSGDYHIQPNTTYYYSPAGTHRGCLRAPEGADFGLALWQWDGTQWVLLETQFTLGGSAPLEIGYDLPAGYYEWVIYAVLGSGTYEFFLQQPGEVTALETALELEGLWTYTAAQAELGTGQIQLTQGTDGTLTGTFTGTTVSGSVTAVQQDGATVTFQMTPQGWLSYFLVTGTLTSTGGSPQLTGTTSYYGTQAAFTMTR